MCIMNMVVKHNFEKMKPHETLKKTFLDCQDKNSTGTLGVEYHSMYYVLIHPHPVQPSSKSIQQLVK